MNIEDEITALVCRALDERPHAEVLSALVANLVGLVTAMTDAQGHDSSKSITLDAGETGRSVTIHPTGATIQ